MERDFKGIWIPKEIWEKFNCKAAVLICAYRENKSLISKAEKEYLKENGLLIRNTNLPYSIKDILSNKSPQSGIGVESCEWCKCKTIILHEHHFPIPKKDGGNETVKICPNCHYEFHYLMDYEYKLTDEILNLLKEGER